MRKVSIVAPLGTSPPVITEFLRYVEEVLDQRVTDLTIISTKEPLVLDGLELVKVAVADRYPKVHVHVVELPYEDVDSEERSREFVRTAAKILRDQKEKYRVEVVHLCVAGGRKQVCIILSLLAQFYNVNGVYHIVMPDVTAFNQALELIRYEMKELLQVEDKLAYYREKKERLEPVLYPEPSTYNVIKIPVVPYPMRSFFKLRQILKPRKVEITPVNSELILRLKTLGYVEVTHNFAYLTAEGERLLHFVERVAS